MKKIALSLFIFFVGLGILSDKCQAEGQEVTSGFSVNPFFREVTLEENQAESIVEVEIANNTDSLAVLKLAVVDFGALDETGGVAFLGNSKDLTNKYALSSWISLEKDALVINSGEKQAVRVTIQNKESLSPGGHYAAILAKLDAGDSSLKNKPSEVALNPSFSSLLFVRKIGGENSGLNLKSFELDRGFFSLAEKAYLRFQNTGNIHLNPRGVVSLTDPLGRVVMRGVINSDSALILPETFRIFPTTLQKIALAFIPGKYVVLIDYRYDGQSEFVSQQQRIFVIPMAFLLLCVSIAIAAGSYLWFKKKKNKNS